MDEDGRKVAALSDQSAKLIEAPGYGLQVVLADEGGTVAGVVEGFGEGPLIGVEGTKVIDFAVEVAVPSGQDSGPAGGTDRVGYEAVPENHTSLGDAVEVGRFGEFSGVSGDRALGVVVAHDEEDVRAGRGRGCRRIGGRIGGTG